MTRGSDSQRVVYDYGEPSTGETSAEQKRLARTRRLVGVALLAFILVAAAVVFAPSLLTKHLPRLRRARSASAAPSPAGPLPTVQIAWENLDLGAMPGDVAQDLKSGKYYYDKPFPGNFGLAIGYWKLALAHPDVGDRDGVQCLVASAERELAGQFTSDSGDAVVLLKQGKRDLALALLEKMRADFPDVKSHQYAWASVTLSRLRR